MKSNIKYWKPNPWQKFLYLIKIKKDPRYNGKKINWITEDEKSLFK